jgi:hypothetical protein
MLLLAMFASQFTATNIALWILAVLIVVAIVSRRRSRKAKQSRF